MNTLIICLTIIASIAIICYTLYKVLDAIIVNEETTNEMISDMETVHRLCADIPEDSIYISARPMVAHILDISSKHVDYERGVESTEES